MSKPALGAGLLGGHLGGGRRDAAGVAGAITGIIFASGPIDYNYDQVYDAFTGISSDASNSKGQVFEEFVVGVLKMFGAATVGGYLDVGLIQRTASRLFEGLKDVAGKVDTIWKRRSGPFKKRSMSRR